jgi:carboxymethylenebutenolidase
MLTSRKDFHDAHLAPEPFTYVAESGKMTSFTTPDGKTGSAFAVKSGKKTKNVVIMVHEWWGLNDYIKREAETLQKELGNVDVYAVDLYDGQVAADPQTAGKLMGGMSPERASNIVKGLIASFGPDVNVATIGWCMGGSWSFQSALLAGSKTKACVMYYGFPEKDVEKMKPLASDILFIQATQDGFIKNEDVETFAKSLESVGKKITIKQYAADHAFANPSNPKYSKAFADEAHQIALAYLKKGLGL